MRQLICIRQFHVYIITMLCVHFANKYISWKVSAETVQRTEMKTSLYAYGDLQKVTVESKIHLLIPQSI